MSCDILEEKTKLRNVESRYRFAFSLYIKLNKARRLQFPLRYPVIFFVSVFGDFVNLDCRAEFQHSSEELTVE